ncbi:siphovirus ReqiPepy6 Gp37-like family protein [Clostridium sporogenes]|uniref:siphovirus ReqiPepy6 Gp37-like family protein n=1 Tax=Clostridium sporogenes TaxID=1509 RepID=UPI0022374BB0|nr:siphovirus ReqiPepy6 Gp37-like family protein [Clostridium sporogenes]MCW6112423.1 siphovirus ReqiPepy6 Gp37-like family protein [Clostridium sporogenes]
MDTIDNFTSLQWIRRYHDTGRFELHCPITESTIRTLARDNLVWIKNSKELGIIEYRNLSVGSNGEETLKINGRFVTSILDRRIQYNTEQYTNKELEIILRNIVDKNCINTMVERKLPLTLGSLNSFIEKIDYQKSYGNLLEEIKTLSETNSIGFFIRTDLESRKHYFEIYKGIDRSINQYINSPVIFSRDYDNLYEQEYTDSTDNLKTTSVVAGEGEGAARKIITVNNNFKGLDRRELFVDARDLQKESEDEGIKKVLTDTEYNSILIQRGKEKLSECKDIKTFEGKIISNNYEYKKDYDLGDIVTVMDKKWNITVDTRITEVTEVYEGGKVQIVPTLGNKIPTILDKIKTR